jgi:hypothetical protein
MTKEDSFSELEDALAAKCCRFLLQRHGARFEQNFALEDAIGSHACSLEALASE